MVLDALEYWKVENKKLKEERQESMTILQEANSDIIGDIKKGLTKEKLKKENKELKKAFEDQHKYSCELGDYIDKQKAEKEKLKEEIEELKESDDCIDGVLKSVENIVRCYGIDNKLPEEDLECTGCRIRQIGDFVVFMIKGIQKDKFPVVEATPDN